MTDAAAPSASSRHIVVRLDDAEQLFVARPPSPTSTTYTEFTAQPAMDTIRDVILMRLPRRRGEIVLDLLLPPAQIHPGLDEQLTIAVRRWVRVQNRMEGESSEVAGSIGRRLFIFGLLAFLVLQTASITVKKWADTWNSLPVSAIGEGLSVTSWVMLWFPVQIFTVEAWRNSLRRHRMRTLERMTVRVHPHGVMPPMSADWPAGTWPDQDPD